MPCRCGGSIYYERRENMDYDLDNARRAMGAGEISQSMSLYEKMLDDPKYKTEAELAIAALKIVEAGISGGSGNVNDALANFVGELGKLESLEVEFLFVLAPLFIHAIKSNVPRYCLREDKNKNNLLRSASNTMLHFYLKRAEEHDEDLAPNVKTDFYKQIAALDACAIEVTESVSYRSAFLENTVFKMIGVKPIPQRLDPVYEHLGMKNPHRGCAAHIVDVFFVLFILGLFIIRTFL